MNRRDISLVLGALPLAAALVGTARADTVRDEAVEHPRIARAIRELEDAIHYLEEAPHNFGGHKAEAIEASRRAVQQLRLALAYRARRE